MKKLSQKVISIWSIAQAVNSHRIHQLWILIGFFVLALWNRLRIKKRIFWKIRIEKFNRSTPFYITSGSDFAVLKEVFIDEEYGQTLASIPATIIDLGSNVGLTVIYFKLKYPEAAVFAVEADPATFKLLKVNTAALSKVNCINTLITQQDGIRTFYVHPTSSISSSMVKRTSDQEAITVQARSLDSLISELKLEQIDLLKFDIEGAEFESFASFKNTYRTKALIGEIHLDLSTHTEAEFVSYFPHFKINTIEVSPTRKILFITAK